jgi:hypothetical protein
VFVSLLLIVASVHSVTETVAQPGQNPKKANAGDKRSAPVSKPSPERSGRQPDNANKPSSQELAPTDSGTPAPPNDGAQKGADQTQKGTNQDQKDSNQTTLVTTIMDWIIPVLLIVGGVLILVLIGTGILHLRSKSQQQLQHQLNKIAAANASVMREAQKEILDKLSLLSSAQSDTSTRLHEVHTEIRTLARLVRETSPSRGDGRSYASIASSPSYSYNDPSPPKEEPEFPVFAGDYIDKMTRYSNVVKPDFQNGILINDPEGRGELMLIRDSRLPDETQPLFVVPRHVQFQTPQDFHTYYEKYYDCYRPGAGEVWIIDPAVVEKVSGGWLLREKGVLEIR